MSHFLAAIVFASSSAAPAATPPIYAVAGCYAVSVGPWLPAPEPGPNTRLLALPAHVNLTSKPGIGASAQRHLMVVPALGATSQHDPMYWGVAPDGEVRIVLESGASGLALSLRLHGSKLTGTARTFWRGPYHLYPEQSAPAVLLPVSCFPVAARAG